MDRSEIEARVAKAHALHESGYNCAQSVACACADLVGLAEGEAFRLTEGFGGGMGAFTGTCGAISGGVAVIGYAMSAGPEAPRSKAATYRVVRQLVNGFREKNGSTLCKELKGQTGGPVLRSCPGCVEDGCRLTVELLAELG